MYQEFAQIIIENDFIVSMKDKEEHDKKGNFLFITKYQNGSDESKSAFASGFSQE